MSAGAPREVVIVGLGEVARTHLAVLEGVPGVAVVAGVDDTPPPEVTFRDRDVPVYPAVRDAARAHQPSLVVVATPTPTHAEVCAEAATWFPEAELLVEKPLADSLADARRLHEDPALGGRLNVALHMAFSPEVTWGEGQVRDRAGELGRPVAVQQHFTDPYEADLATAVARLSSSWIDSGINALSVLDRFVTPVRRASLHSLGESSWSAFEGHITCRTGDAGAADIDALVLTSWHVTAPARTTRVTYASGAELVMDHVAVAGYLVEGGVIRALFGSDGSVARRESHYRALYRSWLVEGKPIIPAERGLLLHELLLSPAH